MNREELLNKARDVVMGQREKEYSGPEDSFQTIASLWTEYLRGRERGKDTKDPFIVIRSVDVALMLGLLKIARLAHSGGTHEDSWVDLAGYAACGSECSGGTSKKSKTYFSEVERQLAASL